MGVSSLLKRSSIGIDIQSMTFYDPLAGPAGRFDHVTARGRTDAADSKDSKSVLHIG